MFYLLESCCLLLNKLFKNFFRGYIFFYSVWRIKFMGFFEMMRCEVSIIFGVCVQQFDDIWVVNVFKKVVF